MKTVEGRVPGVQLLRRNYYYLLLATKKRNQCYQKRIPTLIPFRGRVPGRPRGCSFVEKGTKVAGKYLVITFPYSNASFCQLLHNKDVESILSAMRTIFEYLNDVPHTMWFDNDAALVTFEHKDKLKRIINASFNRFKLHYDFKAVFTNPNRGYEKGAVEAGVRYMRKNLLVPLPSFDDFDEYNRKLLDCIFL